MNSVVFVHTMEKLIAQGAVLLPTQCPICNGYYPLQQKCSRCDSSVVDEGRLDQLYGPYSPYREIDHIKLTNGYMDASQHLCIHVVHCPNCTHEELSFIQEIDAF